LSFKDAILDLFGFLPEEPAKPAARASAKPAPPPEARGNARPSTPATQSPPAPPPSAIASLPLAERGDRDEAALLEIARRAGGGFLRVVLTRNRRVMASVARGGAELRLNHAFASAPEAVIVAAAVLFSSRDRRVRNAARETVRRFITAIPAAGSSRHPRRRHVPAHDRPHLERLREEFTRANAEYFDDTLPSVPLYLSGQMRRRNGHFSPQPLEIVISRRLCVHGMPGEAELTLRHEMIHLWQHATGRPVDHGAEFRRMARRLDVHPRATRPVRWRDG
jgi:hypothetical protein